MKKLLISLLLITPFLTGCTNIDTRLTLNKDKSAQVVSSVTYKGNLADKSDKNARLIEKSYEDFLNDDYKIDSAYGTKLSTVTGSKQVDSLLNNDIDLSSLGFKTNLPSGRFIDIKKNFLVTSFNFDAEYDYPAILLKMEEKINDAEKSVQPAMEPEYLQKYADVSEMPVNTDTSSDFADNLDDSAKFLNQKNLDDADKPINPPKPKPEDEDITISFSIELPSFAYFNNADSTDGNIYTWNIKKDAPTVIKLQYVKYSGFAVFSIIFIGIILLVYIAYRILRHDAQKRVGTNN